MTAKECKRFFDKITTSAFLWQKVISMFDIEGLPLYINQRILKSWLFMSGMIALWKDTDGTVHYGVARYGGGKINEDGTNTKVTVSTVTTTHTLDVDSTGIVWLNSVRVPLLDTVERYSTFMCEGDKSLMSALYNVRSVKLPIASTDAEREQWKDVFKAQENGQRAVPVVPMTLFDTGRSQVADLSNGTANTLKDVMDFRQRINAEFDNQLGIGVFDGLKRERMVTDELNNLESSSRFNVQDMFETIQAGLEDCNSKLGLELKLKYSSAYSVETLNSVSFETPEEEVVSDDVKRSTE